MPAVVYDPAFHAHPVQDAFQLGTGISRAAFKANLASRRWRCWVFEGIEPVVIDGKERRLVTGHLVTCDGDVVWAYTKPKSRGFGVFRRLLEAAGIDSAGEITMLTRTPSSDRLAIEFCRRGWRICFAANEEKAS